MDNLEERVMRLRERCQQHPNGAMFHQSEMKEALSLLAEQQREIETLRREIAEYWRKKV